MKRIIICEGKTDAILIGYFLSNTRSLNYTPEGSSIGLPIKEPDQSLTWYKDMNMPVNEFGVWSVGGIDRVGPAIENIVKRNTLERKDHLRLKRILVIVDMDDVGLQSRIATYKEWLNKAGLSRAQSQNLQDSSWDCCQYTIHATPSKTETIELRLFVIPEHSNGCIETYLLNSLNGEGGEHQVIVKAAREFIQGLGNISFIRPRRFKDKACLGSTLSVIFPDWVFSKIDKKLKSVNWCDFQGTDGLRAILDNL